MPQIIFDGPRHAIIKSTSAETISISSLVGSPTKVEIISIWYDAGINTDCQVLWDATTDVLAWNCNGRAYMDFESFGGITNNAGAGITGGIVITGTTAFSIILKLQK
jgi:hypothetical protein